MRRVTGPGRTSHGLSIAFLMLSAACSGDAGNGAGFPEGASSARETPPAVEAPRDAAEVQSISPTRGAPGTEVTLRAAGLPAATAIEVGFGAPQSNFEIVGQARTDTNGEVTIQVRVPTWAEPGQVYMFVVAPVNQPPRAASDTFLVTPPVGP